MQTGIASKQNWTRSGTIRTDLPLMVVPKAGSKRFIQTVRPGQLFCVGEVYLKTHDGLIRLKVA